MDTQLWVLLPTPAEGMAGGRPSEGTRFPRAETRAGPVPPEEARLRLGHGGSTPWRHFHKQRAQWRLGVWDVTAAEGAAAAAVASEASGCLQVEDEDRSPLSSGMKCKQRHRRNGPFRPLPPPTQATAGFRAVKGQLMGRRMGRSREGRPVVPLGGCGFLISNQWVNHELFIKAFSEWSLASWHTGRISVLLRQRSYLP